MYDMSYIYAAKICIVERNIIKSLFYSEKGRNDAVQTFYNPPKFTQFAFLKCPTIMHQ